MTNIIQLCSLVDDEELRDEVACEASFEKNKEEQIVLMTDPIDC